MKKPLSFVFIVGVVLAIIPVGWILSARSAATQDGLQAPIHVEVGAVIGTPAWA